MFKFENFKLVRKFLVLAVLSAGLFVTSSTNQAGAYGGGCCSTQCDEPWYECIALCQSQFPQSPQWQQQCIQNNCWPPYYFCMQHCDPGC